MNGARTPTPLLKAREYPKRNQMIVTEPIAKKLCMVVESTFFRRTMPL